MTMKEKLSALIDAELDELDERRTLKALADDGKLRSTWERYHLIRAVMTRQLEALAAPGLAERVMARLDDGTRRIAAPPLRFWPLAGGFAAAASVAAIAILTFQAIEQPSAPSGAPTAAVASTAGGSPPVTATVTPAVMATSDPEERLDLYLVGHNEFMPIAGIGGMLPYVRVVTHNQDK
jgi:sigma-E factor negative regulatory protein RseA